MSLGVWIGRRVQTPLLCILAGSVVAAGGAAAVQPRLSPSTAAVAAETVESTSFDRPEQLVFQKGRFYVRWTPGSHRRPTRILPVEQMPAYDIASIGHRIYWVRPFRNTFRESIRRVSEAGRHPATLVRRIGLSLDVSATRRFLFWEQSRSIGRVRVDGTNRRREWLVLRPQARGYPMVDAIGTHDGYLYMSQCLRNRIGRVPITAPPRQRQVDWFIRGVRTCPEELAFGPRFIYWSGATLPGAGVIGRVPINGGEPENRWTMIDSQDGPWDVALAGRFVYWTWGGSGPNGQTHLARVRPDGTKLERKFRDIGSAPMAATIP
jgi:hypothetical protein